MLTLTPNRRLAAFLVQQHNKQQVALNKKVWETPAIYPLEAWFNQLWLLSLEQGSDNSRPVLNSIQQQLLWEQIIQNSDVGAELLSISATAKNAMQAWKFVCQWQISLDKLAAYAEYSLDTAVFYNWLELYLKWLDAHDFSDFNLMLNQVISNLPGCINKLPRRICLIGIDEMPPQYENLFDVLVDNGIQIETQHAVKPGAKLIRSGFSSIDVELNAAAEWASKELDADPQTIIGIVVPQLELNRKQVSRIFSAKINPKLINISAPAALAGYALIDSALLILQLAKPLINYEDFSILLRSPYIAAAELEIVTRAILDKELREKIEAKNFWTRLINIIENYDTKLNSMLSNFTNCFIELQGKHAAEFWAEKIEALLKCWGWPGDRGLTSEESDLFSCWQDLLDNYRYLSVVTEEHTYVQALQYIQRLAIETPFLPAETGGTRLHVLGVLEAAGIFFDKLWVTGFERNAWPPDAAPNPFIPLVLQRQVDMPRSSPQRELKVARRLTATLKQGASQEVIFSYPLHVDDHISQASNLISDIPELPLNIDFKSETKANINFEEIIDEQGLIVQDLEIKGGSSVLKAQAQCQFKAYAEYRLKARALIKPELILSAAQRGNIVHAVMEHFWQYCKTQSELLKISPQTLTEVLSNIITKVLNTQRSRSPLTLDDNYVMLEKNRLLNLISRWLEYEKKRETFRVNAVEQKLSIIVGPLLINLRVDRIDELGDNSLLIIDYKTGVNSLSSWYNERIIEPQLPLYTMQFDANMVSIAIADMQPSVLMLKTVKHDDSWLELVKEWRASLSKTAFEFANGIAKLNPYSDQVCRTCKLHTLCRIYDC